MIVPIRRDLNPYGFISKYQALQGKGSTVPQVAEAVFGILSKHTKSKQRLLKCLVDLLLVTSSEPDAKHWLGLISQCEKPVTSELVRLRVGAQEKAIVTGSLELTEQLNAVLRANKIEELSPQGAEIYSDDDIPF